MIPAAFNPHATHQKKKKKSSKWAAIGQNLVMTRTAQRVPCWACRRCSPPPRASSPFLPPFPSLLVFLSRRRTTGRAAAQFGLRRALCRRRAPTRYALPFLFPSFCANRSIPDLKSKLFVFGSESDPVTICIYYPKQPCPTLGPPPERGLGLALMASPSRRGRK